MVPSFSRGAGRAAAVLCLVAAALAGAVFMQAPPAQAQGIMAAPACQCSTPTVVPGLSMTVVHCVCGGMACVISEHNPPNKTSTPLMQCVR